MSYFIEVIQDGRPSIVVSAPTLDAVRMAPRPGEGEPIKLDWQDDGPGKWRCLVTASVGTASGFAPVEILFTAQEFRSGRLMMSP
jgi:hypothetical protein